MDEPTERASDRSSDDHGTSARPPVREDEQGPWRRVVPPSEDMPHLVEVLPPSRRPAPVPVPRPAPLQPVVRRPRPSRIKAGYASFQSAIQERPLVLSGRTERVVELSIYVTLLVLLLIFFHPNLLWSTTTTTGGDTGAHIYAPWYLKNHLLTKGLLSGWSPGWFAGFPMLHFYFPLVATFQAVLSFLLPYQVAFKLGTILGTFFLPVSFYLLFRLLRFRFPAPIIAAVLGVSFLFMDSFTIYGGNIASSLAGEYSFAFSVGLCFVFYGLAYRVATEDRARPLLAGGVLAMAVLSHVVPVVMIVLFSPAFFWWAIRHHGWKGGLRRMGVMFGVAFALTAFWAIPFVVRLGYTANMRWQPIEGLNSLFPKELWLYCGGAVVGLLLAMFRRDPRVVVLAAPTVMAAALYLFIPQGHVWNGRFLPFWYLGIYLMCAYALGTGLAAVADAFPRRLTSAVALSMVALIAVGSGGWILWNKNKSFVQYWIQYNYEGYEGKDAFPLFKELTDRISQLPPGRVMWEPNSSLGRFGTPVALMSLPYWANHPSMEGMYFESSITTPFHFLMASEVAESPSNPIADLPYNGLDLTKGLAHMRMFDVSYYLTVTNTARVMAMKEPGLTHLWDLQDFSMFRVDDSAQVEVPKFAPVRYTGPDWIDANVTWFSNPDDLQTPLVRGGPSSWPEVSSAQDPLPQTPLKDGGDTFNATVTDDSISFDTTAIGEPHWIKTSYFPNWKVEGAEGPYLASPSMMMVIPTQTHVRLYYSRTWAEWLGLFLTLAIIVLLILPPGRRLLHRLAYGRGGTSG